MKPLYYLIFKYKIFNRFCELNLKQENRIKRLKIVINKINNEYYDLPISIVMPDLCEILKIENNSSAVNFIHKIIISDNLDINEHAKKLPLI